MKKIISLLIISFLIIFITGCGEDKELITICKIKEDHSSIGYTKEDEYEIHSTKGIVSRAILVETIESEDWDLLVSFKEELTEKYEELNENYGGVKNNVGILYETLTSKTNINYDKLDIVKLIKDNPENKDLVNNDNKITLEKLKKHYISQGAKCE